MTAKITNVQYRALKALAASKKPMTRRELADAAFNGNSINFSPILNPLVKAKLVKSDELPKDGELRKDGTVSEAVETVFTATALGRKEAAKAPADLTRGAGKHQPLPKPGGVIERTYLGKVHKVTVTADGFRYQNKNYPSLTATAKAVRGSDQEVNGWAFFGLTKDGGVAAKAPAKPAKKPAKAKAPNAKPAPKTEVVETAAAG